MRTGIDHANAPGAALQIQEALRKQVTLPDNMRLNVEVIEPSTGALERVDFSKLLGDINFNIQPPSQEGPQ